MRWPQAWEVELLSSIVLTLASMWVPVWLGARSAAHRPHFALRATCIIAAMSANFAAGALTIPIDRQTVALMLKGASQLALAPFVIFALLPLVTWVLYDVSPGDAMYVSAQGYALQNLGSGLRETGALVWDDWSGGLLLPAAVLIYGLVYLAFFWLVRRRQKDLPNWRQAGASMLLAMVLVMFLVIFFDEVIKASGGSGLWTPYVLALRTVHVGTCLFVLWCMYQMAYNQELRLQMAAERNLRAEEERRWELFQQNVETINIKCHDIRRQIRRLRDGAACIVDAGVLNDIEREVEIYDSQVRTGNAALDAVLSEKRLVCDQAGVELSVMADGAALAGMPPADVYALFGSALDNAIRAAREASAKEGRYILVTVRLVAGMVAVHVENSFARPAAQVADGLPQPTKDEGAQRDFGVLSMQRLAERYGGTLAMTSQGQVFSLDVLLDTKALGDEPSRR